MLQPTSLVLLVLRIPLFINLLLCPFPRNIQADNSSKKERNYAYYKINNNKKKKKKKKNYRVFNLAEPTYDFITDSYQSSKPYVMQVGGYQRIVSQQKKRSSDNEMLDLIDYLGGASTKKQESRRIQLLTKNAKLDFTQQPKETHAIEIKLDGGKPGKILNDSKANAFLDRVEFYVRNPSELVL
jgi:hypothetical protein